MAYSLGTGVVAGKRRCVEREALDEYHEIVCRLGARASRSTTADAATARTR